VTGSPFREGRLGVDDRIGLVGSAFAQGALRCETAVRGTPGEVPIEVEGEQYLLATTGGVPTRLSRATGPVEWSVIVSDWELVVPVAPVRGISELRGCGIRIGDRTWPVPQLWEVDQLTPERFPERMPNALIYFYYEHYGSPVGSYSCTIAFRDGVPEYVADTPEFPEKTPHLAMGYSFAQYFSYRCGRTHQLAVTDGSWADGNWKDMLAVHGLHDMPGFRRLNDEYPELPPALWDYMWVLAEAAKLPQAAPDRGDAEETPGDPAETPGDAAEASPM
jgi:hypothetical protein